MKITKITSNILHLKFSSQRALTSTLLRFQEHYENIHFRNKIFTLKEFKSWYTKEKGKFSYYTDWAGFNFPGYIFTPFITNKFKRLSKKEKHVLKRLRPTEAIYVIGTFRACGTSTLNHEIAHGLFYTNHSYQKKALKLVRSLPETSRSPITKFLKKHLYHSSVWEDEIHAYLGHSLDMLEQKVILDKHHLRVAKALNKLFKITYANK